MWIEPKNCIYIIREGEKNEEKYLGQRLDLFLHGLLAWGTFLLSESSKKSSKKGGKTKPSLAQSNVCHIPLVVMEVEVEAVVEMWREINQQCHVLSESERTCARKIL